MNFMFERQQQYLTSERSERVRLVDCEFMDRDEHAKKELGQYPAILISQLVNNQYVQQRGTGALTCLIIWLAP